jgi:hypothetical protein
MHVSRINVALFKQFLLPLADKCKPNYVVAKKLYFHSENISILVAHNFLVCCLHDRDQHVENQYLTEKCCKNKVNQM